MEFSSGHRTISTTPKEYIIQILCVCITLKHALIYNSATRTIHLLNQKCNIWSQVYWSDSSVTNVSNKVCQLTNLCMLLLTWIASDKELVHCSPRISQTLGSIILDCIVIGLRIDTDTVCTHKLELVAAVLVIKWMFICHTGTGSSCVGH